jgi:hypothetical protein
MTIVWKVGTIQKMLFIQNESSPTIFRVSSSILVTALSKASTKANAARDKGRRFGVIIEK